MEKSNLTVVIALFFLNAGIFLQPHDAHAANSKSNDIKTLQYFVNMGRLPSGIKKQIEERGKADVIITFDASKAQERARQMRAAKGLRFDNAEIMNEKARIHNIKKSEVLSGIPTYDYIVLKDYSKFPVIYIEINENALRKLLPNPNVKVIGENNKSIPFLSESLPLVHAPEANGLGATGAGSSVAVLDTGVNYTLSAFGSCTAPGVPASCSVIHAQDFAPNDGYLDYDGHGTNVSGIVAGVAPDTKILGLDVFTGKYAYDSDILNALHWVYENRVLYPAYPIKAVNMSFGGPPKYTAPCPTDNLAFPIADLKSAGIDSVIAAGNKAYKDGIERPACIPDAISVGMVYDLDRGGVSWCTNQACDPPYLCTDSTTESEADKVACASNSASFLTMLAPGSTITAAGISLEGTSQATPHVAGAIAAIRSLLPGLSIDSMRALLTSTGVPVTDGRNNIVKPRLDLLAAVPITCSDYPVRIAGGSYYTSLQAAYDAAGNGDIIQANKTIMIGNLNANRSISVTLRGGYNCNFQSSAGYTYVKGSLQKTSGTLNIGNIILIH